MKIHNTDIVGCIVLEPIIYKDSRGDFMETFHKAELEEALGYPIDFVQDNQSVSHKNVLRGLHFQRGKHAQAKLGRVIQGSALDVVVDLRKESPSFGKTVTIELTGENRLQIFIPKGVAHGFLALENQTVFSYKCDAYYNRESEAGILYNDPDLCIDWGIPDEDLILSEKDRALPLFKQLYS
ncbi:dTDP-4-dehydrorhamnose 3,5-epimerase [Lentiprolixibacter aurantiacus]|uniref:dTDP-4-dehydrorhamnose 3,5-epimerase n=1 Tax=Lentiprolixibacter aurantiacus TaxID=2993939 RepID=A0AAE3MK02_9FLAO|nr:dTDP-4-dehydrorhamnose 3,5-epimerase [Lentiprolixibacter aurantiacus]MCX2718537.1 dTDP-4-dehydrorhamnose 3,5-epimerase [Lentiprolixibacter aurantiacus]